MILSNLTRNAISSVRSVPTKLTEHFFNQSAHSNLVHARYLSLTTQRFNERRYHDKHEWVTVEDSIATVGISDYAQKALGPIVFIELPEVNREVEKDDEVGCVESTKSASDIYSPISGKVVEVNEKLESDPQLLNSSPQEDGWIYKMEISNKDQFSRLMSEDQYEKFVKLQTSESRQD